MNTKIAYMYRDESNYKQHEEVILQGEITDAEKEIIMANLDGGEFFIPSQVGLDNIQHRMINFPSEDDHVWHELEKKDITLTEDEPTLTEMDVHQFAATFKDITWNVKEASIEIGLITNGH